MRDCSNRWSRRSMRQPPVSRCYVRASWFSRRAASCDGSDRRSPPPNVSSTRSRPSEWNARWVSPTNCPPLCSPPVGPRWCRAAPAPSSSLRCRYPSCRWNRRWPLRNEPNWWICFVGSECARSVRLRRCPDPMWRRGSVPTRWRRTGVHVDYPTPPAGRAVPPDLTVEHACDPPVERVDTAAFIGRMLAELLHTRLAAAGVACTRLLVSARTGNGEELARTWRCAEPLTPEGTADRVRWQLDGWLTGRSADRPTAGVTMLRLEPVEVVTSGACSWACGAAVGGRGRTGTTGAGPSTGSARRRRGQSGSAQRWARARRTDHARPGRGGGGAVVGSG